MTQSVNEIIEVSRDAAIIAGAERSAVYHGILACAPDAAVVCIMPPYRFNNVLKDHTDCLGMRYGFVVGEGTADSFTVPPDMLLRTLDLANP
ncbi:MAG: glycosyltransferase family 61 protein [Myxococcales bacterium]|nr:glycosyltransferase family 61 protein [Myxococcales bacterium]